MLARLTLCLGLALGLSGCPVMMPILTVGIDIGVKALEIDTAIRNEVRSLRDSQADPNMPGGRGEASGSPGGRGEASGALPERTER
jgi:hypothetical protein